MHPYNVVLPHTGGEPVLLLTGQFLNCLGTHFLFRARAYLGPMFCDFKSLENEAESVKNESISSYYILGLIWPKYIKLCSKTRKIGINNTKNTIIKAPVDPYTAKIIKMTAICNFWSNLA